MRNRRGKIFLFATLAILVAAMLGFVVMNLWNWLIPALAGGRMITFWQALGVLVLSRILFGGFFRRHGFGGPRSARIIDRWERMSPEERERFRQGMRSRCGGRPAEPGSVQA